MVPGPPWANWLRNMGCRLTIPRQEILRVLSKTKQHLSAEDIYMKVHEKHPAVGLTTVYRTLELLVSSRLVTKFDFGDKRARYELVAERHGGNHHHHLVCVECCEVIDYSDFMAEEIKFLENVEKGLSKKHDFKILDHHIQFVGLCKKCSQMNT